VGDDNVLEDFTEDASETNGAIVGCQVALTLLEDRCYISLLPVWRDRASVKGALEEKGHKGRKFHGGFLEYTGVKAIGAGGLVGLELLKEFFNSCRGDGEFLATGVGARGMRWVGWSLGVTVQLVLEFHAGQFTKCEGFLAGEDRVKLVV
jgi:hypothetical protein